MKFKYFLRGFGIGIIFTSIVCLVAFVQNSDSGKMSDKEVIERAKELGMVEEQSNIKEFFSSDKTSSTEQSDTQETENVTTGESEDETVTENVATESEEKSEQESSATENIDVTEKSTEQPTKQTVTITIEGGASSYPICQQLQELGVIDNADEFDNYLVSNGYASRISVGTHTLTIGMTYEEIAVEISDPM